MSSNDNGGIVQGTMTLLDWLAAVGCPQLDMQDIVEKMGWVVRDGKSWKDLPKGDDGLSIMPSFEELWSKLSTGDRHRIAAELQYERARAMLAARSAAEKGASDAD